MASVECEQCAEVYAATDDPVTGITPPQSGQSSLREFAATLFEMTNSLIGRMDNLLNSVRVAPEGQDPGAEADPISIRDLLNSARKGQATLQKLMDDLEREIG